MNDDDDPISDETRLGVGKATGWGMTHIIRLPLKLFCCHPPKSKLIARRGVVVNPLPTIAYTTSVNTIIEKNKRTINIYISRQQVLRRLRGFHFHFFRELERQL